MIWGRGLEGYGFVTPLNRNPGVAIQSRELRAEGLYRYRPEVPACWRVLGRGCGVPGGGARERERDRESERRERVREGQGEGEGEGERF